jgi:hypothetical protein
MCARRWRVGCLRTAQRVVHLSARLVRACFRSEQSSGVWGVACALLYGQGVDVAILQSGEGGFYAEAVQRFHATLEQQGYALQTLTFVLKGDRSDHELPRRILEKRPKIVLAVGTNAVKAIRAHYERIPKHEQAPVVFLQVLDPVGEGLIQSAERSGTRFAGVALTVRPPAATEYPARCRARGEARGGYLQPKRQRLASMDRAGA